MFVNRIGEYEVLNMSDFARHCGLSHVSIHQRIYAKKQLDKNILEVNGECWNVTKVGGKNILFWRKG